MAVTYQKLKSGEWGIRVEGRAVREGQTVTVRKRDGSTKQETVKRVVWSGAGVVLCAVGGGSSSGSSYTPRAGRRGRSGDCPRCGGNESNQVECGECA